MSETKQLKEVRSLISQGENEKATPILWNLFESKNDDIKLDASLALLVVLDHMLETPKLIEVTNAGIDTAYRLGRHDVRAYLLGKKCVFLLTQEGLLIYRQKNLKLAENAFKWIDFSLERDRQEFEAILQKRRELGVQIQDLLDSVLKLAESTPSHYLRGNIFAALADFYSSKYMNDQQDFMKGGPWRSWFAMWHFVRRWNLNLFLYDRRDRNLIWESREKCIFYSKKAISEFEAGNLGTDEAHAVYNFAVKLQSMNLFIRASKLLPQASQLATKHGQKLLLSKIEMLREKIKDRNRNGRNYVEEFGWDLP